MQLEELEDLEEASVPGGVPDDDLVLESAGVAPPEQQGSIDPTGPVLLPGGAQPSSPEASLLPVSCHLQLFPIRVLMC